MDHWVWKLTSIGIYYFCKDLYKYVAIANVYIFTTTLSPIPS